MIILNNAGFGKKIERLRCSGDFLQKELAEMMNKDDVIRTKGISDRHVMLREEAKCEF